MCLDIYLDRFIRYKENVLALKHVSSMIILLVCVSYSILITFYQKAIIFFTLYYHSHKSIWKKDKFQYIFIQNFESGLYKLF